MEAVNEYQARIGVNDDGSLKLVVYRQQGVELITVWVDGIIHLDGSEVLAQVEARWPGCVVWLDAPIAGLEARWAGQGQVLRALRRATLRAERGRLLARLPEIEAELNDLTGA